jgi:hypothetical protein
MNLIDSLYEFQFTDSNYICLFDLLCLCKLNLNRVIYLRIFSLLKYAYSLYFALKFNLFIFIPSLPVPYLFSDSSILNGFLSL